MSKLFKNKKKADSKKEEAVAVNVEELRLPTVAELQQIVDSAVEEKEEVINAANHKAHNVYYDNNLKKFMLVTIEYNLKNNKAKIVSTEPVADDVAVATSKISDIFALKLFRREENV